MRAALAIVALAAGLVPAKARPVAGFRLRGSAAGCAYVAAQHVVACRRERDRAGYGLAATGDPVALTPALSRWALPRRVLAQGRSWSRGGVTCRAAAAAVTCANRSGAAVVVSADAVAALATPAGG